MLRRLLSVLIVFALMACLGTMVPNPAQASVTAPGMTMTGPTMAHAGCMHHHQPHMACHDCPICAGADLPQLAGWNNRIITPAPVPRKPGPTARLTGVRPAGPDRPPRPQA